MHDEVAVEVDDAAPPPVFGSWSRMYAVVIGALAVEILIFYLFTRAFS